MSHPVKSSKLTQTPPSVTNPNYPPYLPPTSTLNKYFRINGIWETLGFIKRYSPGVYPEII